MDVRISDIMVEGVITAVPETTVGEVRRLMRHNRIQSVLVVEPADEVVGIITSTDLIDDIDPTLPARAVMTAEVYEVPAHNAVEVAARMMRKHRIHHLAVTREHKLVGIVSTFDILQLIENRRHGLKNPPKGRGRKSSGEPRPWRGTTRREIKKADLA